MKILWIGLETDIGVDALLMNKNNWDLEKILEFNPDVVIEREFNSSYYDYTEEIQLLRKKLPNAKFAVWFIDTHVVYDRQIIYANLFDYIFLAISSYVDDFKRQKHNAFWLPLCFPTTTMPEKQEKIYDIGYVGRFNVPYLEKRTMFLNKIRSHFGNRCHFVTDYATVYETIGKCKIMLNISYANDMNYRTFEALACRCHLLTNHVPDIDKINGLKEKVNFYSSPSDCVSVINTLLNKEIPDYSDYILENHMLQHRVKSMLCYF
jgi:hypothetical protein